MSSVYCFCSPSNCPYLQFIYHCHSAPGICLVSTIPCLCQPSPVNFYRPLLKSTVPCPCLSFTFYCHNITCLCLPFPRLCLLSPVYVYYLLSMSTVQCLCLLSNVFVYRPMSLSSVPSLCLPSNFFV